MNTPRNTQPALGSDRWELCRKDGTIVAVGGPHTIADRCAEELLAYPSPAAYFAGNIVTHGGGPEPCIPGVLYGLARISVVCTLSLIRLNDITGEILWDTAAAWSHRSRPVTTVARAVHDSPCLDEGGALEMLWQAKRSAYRQAVAEADRQLPGLGFRPSVESKNDYTRGRKSYTVVDVYYDATDGASAFDHLPHFRNLRGEVIV